MIKNQPCATARADAAVKTNLHYSGTDLCSFVSRSGNGEQERKNSFSSAVSKGTLRTLTQPPSACLLALGTSGGILYRGYGEEWFESTPLEKLKRALAEQKLPEPRSLEIVHLAQAHSSSRGEETPQVFDETFKSQLFILNRLLKAGSGARIVFEGFSVPLNLEKKQFLDRLENSFAKRQGKRSFSEISLEEVDPFKETAIREMEARYGASAGTSAYVLYPFLFKDGFPKEERDWSLLQRKALVGLGAPALFWASGAVDHIYPAITPEARREQNRVDREIGPHPFWPHQKLEARRAFLNR